MKMMNGEASVCLSTLAGSLKKSDILDVRNELCWSDLLAFPNDLAVDVGDDAGAAPLDRRAVFLGEPFSVAFEDL